MLAARHPSHLSLADLSDIHTAYRIFTVFNPLTSGTTVFLQELQIGDEVRLCLTPGHEVEQAGLIPYGNILKHIIDVASGPTPTASDDLPKFVIVYE